MSVIIARQPIYDKDLKVFAYELLYRNNAENNFYQATNAGLSTMTVIVNAFVEIGIEKLTNGKYAFINFTEGLLKSEYIKMLPRKYLGVEILETVKCTEENLAAILELKKLGYLVVMDDFIYTKENIRFIEAADIVKIDFMNTDEYIIKNLPLMHKNTVLLAEKIETAERYKLAREYGYKYFQGYYFNRPSIVVQKDIKPLYINIIRILGKLNENDFDAAEIAAIVEFDPAISYKLLKYSNSAAFGGSGEIKKINAAIARIGIREMRMFTMLLLTQCIPEDKPVELIRQSIMRAKICERVAFLLGRDGESETFSMIGLYSLMDVMLETPMKDILSGIRVSVVIKNAILGLNDANARETVYLNAMRLVAAYENGDFLKVDELLNKLNISNDEFVSVTLTAINWCDSLFNFAQ